MEKKDRCAVFGCNNDSLCARKAHVNTERVAPGHPIILLKSIKFNMAAISVKRSIVFAFLSSNIFRTSSCIIIVIIRSSSSSSMLLLLLS